MAARSLVAAQRLARYAPVQVTERARPAVPPATVAVILLIAGRAGVADVRGGRGHPGGRSGAEFTSRPGLVRGR